jgi:hypothetical protein
MHTAAIARYLHVEGAVVFDQQGADCFLESLPPAPVDAVGVFTLPRAGDDLERWGRAGFQLIVRSEGGSGDARAGYDRASDLRAILHGLRHETLAPGTPDELRVVSCVAETRTPVGLGRDAEQRHRWSVSFDLQIMLDDGRTLP